MDCNCFPLLWLMFPVTFLSTYPMQTDRHGAVEGLADNSVMKEPRSSWGKVTWKGKAGCVKPVGRRKETLPLALDECVSMSEGVRKSWWRSLQRLVSALDRGTKCVTVCVVRWGQRSQPADAREASRAGSQDGCSQTLIRGTHHSLSCFHHSANLSHRCGVCDLALSTAPCCL